MKSPKPKSPDWAAAAEDAHKTGRKAETMFRALSARVGNRWKFISFRGKSQREWRGIVDVLAIRKNTAQPTFGSLKRGDLFDIVLVQIKGGTARSPTANDRRRLLVVAQYYNARDVVQFCWKDAECAEFSVLQPDLTWKESTGAQIFGALKPIKATNRETTVPKTKREPMAKKGGERRVDYVVHPSLLSDDYKAHPMNNPAFWDFRYDGMDPPEVRFKDYARMGVPPEDLKDPKERVAYEEYLKSHVLPAPSSRSDGREGLPMIHVGPVKEGEGEQPLVQVPGIEIDDDEELAVTPPDVVALLGFDPKEFSDDRSEVAMTARIPATVLILEVLAEGGSIKLYGRQVEKGWEFQRQVIDQTPELIDEAWINHASGVARSWEEAVQLLDKYPWHHMVPDVVHAAFRGKVWAEISRRAGEGEPMRYVDRWREKCGQRE